MTLITENLYRLSPHGGEKGTWLWSCLLGQGLKPTAVSRRPAESPEPQLPVIAGKTQMNISKSFAPVMILLQCSN